MRSPWRVGSELERFPHLTFAVLFGSAASGRLRPDSDVDVAVYGASGRPARDRARAGSRPRDRDPDRPGASDAAQRGAPGAEPGSRNGVRRGTHVRARGPDEGRSSLLSVLPRSHLGGHRLPADRTRIPGDSRPQPLTGAGRPQPARTHRRLHRHRVGGSRAIPGGHAAPLSNRPRPAAQPRPLGGGPDQRRDRHRQDRAVVRAAPRPPTRTVRSSRTWRRCPASPRCSDACSRWPRCAT